VPKRSPDRVTVAPAARAIPKSITLTCGPGGRRVGVEDPGHLRAVDAPGGLDLAAEAGRALGRQGDSATPSGGGAGGRRQGWWKRPASEKASQGRRPQASSLPRAIAGHCERRL
jgi:hypothetical protein